MASFVAVFIVLFIIADQPALYMGHVTHLRGCNRLGGGE